MKANVFLFVLSVAVSALLGYLVYSVAGVDPNALLAGLFSTLCFICTLIPAFGFRYKTHALSVNLRTLSIVAFVIMLFFHIAFAAIVIKMPYYLIVNGIILCLYLGIAYSFKRY